MLSLLSSNLL